MKISFAAPMQFTVKTKEVTLAISQPDLDEATVTTTHDRRDISGGGRIMTLPGEYEISSVLIKGISTSTENTIFKFIVGDTTIVHFGILKEMPSAAIFEELGETVTIALVAVTKDFDAKKVDDLLDKMSPPVAIVGGDSSLFPMVQAESGAITHEGAWTYKKSETMSENTKVLLLT